MGPLPGPGFVGTDLGFPERGNTDGKKTHRCAENAHMRNPILELLEIQQPKFKEEEDICQLEPWVFLSCGQEEGLKNGRLLSRHHCRSSPPSLSFDLRRSCALSCVFTHTIRAHIFAVSSMNGAKLLSKPIFTHITTSCQISVKIYLLHLEP